MATQLGADFVQAHKDAEKDDSAFKDFIRYMTYSVATQLGKGATDAVLTKFNESAVNNKKALWDTSKGQDYDGKYDTLSRTTQTVKDRLKKADAAGDALAYYRDLGYNQAIPRFRVNNKTGVTYSDESLKLLLQEEVDKIAKANLKKDRDLLAFADKKLLTPDQFAQHKTNINFRSGNVIGRQFNKIRNMFSDKDLETQRWTKIYEGDTYKNMDLLQEKIKEMAQKGVDPSSFAEILDKIKEEENTLGYNRYDPRIIAGMKIVPEYSEKEVPNNDGSIDDVTMERKFNPENNRIEVREVNRRTAKIDDSYLLGKSETIADYIKGRQFLPAVARQIESDLASNFDVSGGDLNSNISFKKFGEYQQVIDFIAKKYNSNMANYKETAVGKLAQLDLIDKGVQAIPELYEAVMSGAKLDNIALIQLKRIKNAAVARSAVKNNWGQMDEGYNLLPLGHISGGVNPDTGEVLAIPDPNLELRPEQINEYNIRFQRGMNGYPFSTGQSIQTEQADVSGEFVAPEDDISQKELEIRKASLLEPVIGKSETPTDARRFLKTGETLSKVDVPKLPRMLKPNIMMNENTLKDFPELKGTKFEKAGLLGGVSQDTVNAAKAIQYIRALENKGVVVDKEDNSFVFDNLNFIGVVIDQLQEVDAKEGLTAGSALLSLQEAQKEGQKEADKVKVTGNRNERARKLRAKQGFLKPDVILSNLFEKRLRGSVLSALPFPLTNID